MQRLQEARGDAVEAEDAEQRSERLPGVAVELQSSSGVRLQAHAGILDFGVATVNAGLSWTQVVLWMLVEASGVVEVW